VRRPLRGSLASITGKIVAGQKVRGFHPRAIDWVEPARRDVTEYLLALGLRREPLLPRADGEPWKLHDYAHVIRELKGLPRVSAEDQIEQARQARGRHVDVSART
jgi:hypothetical protein